MAIFHLKMTSIARSAGQSAGEKCAYNCRLGHYARGPGGRPRDPVLYIESFNVPGWTREAAGVDAEAASAAARELWRAADRHERSNGRLAVELEFALLRELSVAENQQLARRFAEEVATLADGGKLPATLAIHAGGGQERNPHAHLLIQERVSPNDGHERGPESWFRRADNKNPARGGARKTRDLQKPEWLVAKRELWATLANEALERAGRSERISHLSNADRGIADAPTEHEGWSRGRPRDAARARNRERRSVNAEMKALGAQLSQIDNRDQVVADLVQPGNEDHHDDRKLDPSRTAQLPGFGFASAGVGDGERHIAGIDFSGGGAHADAPTQPDFAAAPGVAAPAVDLSLRDLRGRRVADRPGDHPGLLHADAHHELDAGGTDGHQRVRREVAGERDFVGPAPAGAIGGPSIAAAFAAARRDPLREASRLWGEMGREVADRMQRWIDRLDAAKAAARAAKAAAKVAPAPSFKAQPKLVKIPTLAAVPTLASLTVRPVARLTDRDLVEQLDIAKKGLASALTPAQADARRARIAALQAEIDKRAAPAAGPEPATVSEALEEVLPDVVVYEVPEALRRAEAELAQLRGVMDGNEPGDLRQAVRRYPEFARRVRELRQQLQLQLALEQSQKQAAAAAVAPDEVPVAAPAPVVPAPPPIDQLAEASRNSASAARDLRQAIETAWASVDEAEAQKASASFWRPGSKDSADKARAQAGAGLRAAIVAARAAKLECRDRASNVAALKQARQEAAGWAKKAAALEAAASRRRADEVAAAAAVRTASLDTLKAATTQAAAAQQARARADRARLNASAPADSQPQQYEIPGRRTRS